MPPFVCPEKVLWSVPWSYVGAELSSRRDQLSPALCFSLGVNTGLSLIHI